MRAKALVLTFCSTGLAIVLSLATSVLLARKLGAEGRGALLACTFYPAVLAAVFNLSLNEATAVHIARAAAGEKVATVSRYESTGLLLQIVTAAVGAALSLLLIGSLLPPDQLFHLGAVQLYVAAFTPFAMLDLHFKAVLQARGAFKALSVLRLCQPVAYTALLAFFVLISQLQIETVLASAVIGLAVSLSTGVWFAGISFAGTSLLAAWENLLLGLRFHLANLLLYFAAEVDKLIVLRLLDDASAGLYVVALSVSTLGASFVGQSLTVLLTRDMAQALTKRLRQTVFFQYVLWSTALLVLINGVAACLASWLMPLIYGDLFAPAVPILKIMLLTGVMKGARQIVDRSMRAIHNTRVGVIGEAVGLVGILTFGLAGAKFAGLSGLAWGIVIAQFCSFAVMLVLAGEALSLDASVLWPLTKEVARHLLSLGIGAARAVSGVARDGSN